MSGDHAIAVNGSVRNKVVGGVIAFLVIGLISTGFKTYAQSDANAKSIDRIQKTNEQKARDIETVRKDVQTLKDGQTTNTVKLESIEGDVSEIRKGMDEVRRYLMEGSRR